MRCLQRLNFIGCFPPSIFSFPLDCSKSRLKPSSFNFHHNQLQSPAQSYAQYNQLDSTAQSCLQHYVESAPAQQDFHQDHPAIMVGTKTHSNACNCLFGLLHISLLMGRQTGLMCLSSPLSSTAECARHSLFFRQTCCLKAEVDRLLHAWQPVLVLCICSMYYISVIEHHAARLKPADPSAFLDKAMLAQNVVR